MPTKCWPSWPRPPNNRARRPPEADTAAPREHQTMNASNLLVELFVEELPPKALQKLDRKSTRLNSSHLVISYAVFCLKKKKKNHPAKRFVETQAAPRQLQQSADVVHPT